MTKLSHDKKHGQNLDKKARLSIIQADLGDSRLRKQVGQSTGPTAMSQLPADRTGAITGRRDQDDSVCRFEPRLFIGQHMYGGG
jgi:hypothetical protein